MSVSSDNNSVPYSGRMLRMMLRILMKMMMMLILWIRVVVITRVYITWSRENVDICISYMLAKICYLTLVSTRVFVAPVSASVVVVRGEGELRTAHAQVSRSLRSVMMMILRSSRVPLVRNSGVTLMISLILRSPVQLSSVVVLSIALRWSLYTWSKIYLLNLYLTVALPGLN